MTFVLLLLGVAITLKTSSSYYICDNGGIFTNYELCDLIPDCSDGTDEHGCIVEELSNQTDLGDNIFELIRRGKSYSTKVFSTTEGIYARESICRWSYAFFCDIASCILSMDRCNGIVNCENGLDEENCDFGSLTAQYLSTNKTKALLWLKNEYSAEWGWNENTHRAVVALYLAGGASFNGSSNDDDFIAKHLELEVATFLLRREHEKVSLSDLAAYINALLVICHDPRNFFGFDLISILKEGLETNSSFVPPFLYLTLCNAKESISEESVIRLLNILRNDSMNHGFVLEIQALSTMALSCINNNGTVNQYLKQNITEALNNLKKHQKNDGSFGNIYTTALVLQALIANNKGIAEDWNIKSSIDYLSSVQKPDGSFGNFLTTYLILPLLNGKSLLDVGKINCSFQRQRDFNTTKDMKNKFGKKITVKYSLFVGDQKYQMNSLVFRAPENITVLDLMTLAADLNPIYEFKIHEIKKKRYIYEISNIPNDPEHNKFWFVYRGLRNGTMPILEQSPDKINVNENDEIIMWFKTLDYYDI